MARELSDSARAAMRDGASARGLRRTKAFTDAVKNAMSLIEREIESNGGVYPQHAGIVDHAEVVRRAGVSNAYYKPKYSDLYIEVESWLAKLKKADPVASVKVRRTVAQRLADSVAAYEQLRSKYLLTWAQHQEELRLRTQAEDRIQELERRLSTMLKASPVTLHEPRS